MKKFDVAIVGGGLAGLAASIYLAKAGKKVIVLEKSNHLGGRGMTINKNGICMNLGAHALYRGGEAFITFNELGINLPGGIPSTKNTRNMERRYFHHPNRFSLNFINTVTFMVCKNSVFSSYDSFRKFRCRKKFPK